MVVDLGEKIDLPTTLAIKERVVEDENSVSGRKAVNPLGGRRTEIPQWVF